MHSRISAARVSADLGWPSTWIIQGSVTVTTLRPNHTVRQACLEPTRPPAEWHELPSTAGPRLAAVALAFITIIGSGESIQSRRRACVRSICLRCVKFAGARLLQVSGGG